MNMSPQRVSAAYDEEFVVFLVGMRFRVRQVKYWRSAFKAMTRMVSELSRDPESGYLGGESWIGNPTVMIQYWRSFEHLQRYAHDPTRHHQPAWAAFNDAIREGADLGVWHEAYRVRPGEHSTIYNRMPPFGLARSTRATRFSSRRSAMQRVTGLTAVPETLKNPHAVRVAEGSIPIDAEPLPGHFAHHEEEQRKEHRDATSD